MRKGEVRVWGEGEEDRKHGRTERDGGKRNHNPQTTGARSSEDMSSEDMILWFYPTTEEEESWTEPGRGLPDGRVQNIVKQVRDLGEG